MTELGAEHRAVLLLVVELETLDEVLVASLVLVLLDLAEDGQKLLEVHGLLAALLRAAELLDRGVGRVRVQGAEYIAQIHAVDRVRAVSIVDGEGELCLCFGRKKGHKSDSVSSCIRLICCCEFFQGSYAK